MVQALAGKKMVVQIARGGDVGKEDHVEHALFCKLDRFGQVRELHVAACRNVRVAPAGVVITQVSERQGEA